jgi:[acyl-carrier-protein] S-malonyltransferase
MGIAFVFPGQGSHRPGAGRAWAGDPAADLLDEIGHAIGRDVAALLDDPGTGGRTADAQPAIFAASLVAWRALLEAGVRPDVVAGHSLGEITATVASGVLGIQDGSRVVAARAEAMAHACARRPGGMAAVLKCGRDAVRLLVEDDAELVVANDNAPGQVVVAGTRSAIDRLRDRVRSAGGRALPLDVEGAFHSPAMEPAAEALQAALDAADWRPVDVPLVTATSGEVLADPAGIAMAIAGGMLEPVHWRAVQQRLVDLGVRDLVEVGPGGVLAGLAKRTAPALRVHGVATPADVTSVAATLADARVGAMR